VSAALHIAAFRRRYLADHAVLEATALALLTALLGYGNRFLRGDMTEGMAVLFRECEAGGDYDHICQCVPFSRHASDLIDAGRTSVQWRMVNSLLLATIIRGALVVVSTGCRVPAGIFVPSMAVGAAFGRMLGIVVNAAYRAYPASGVFAYCKPDVPCITPGTYAFLGAAAALRCVGCACAERTSG
jgi:chloride channel 3/4/5